MKKINIYKNIKFSKDKEIEETIFENGKVRIARICSLDQVTDYYDQNLLEIVKIERGWAVLEIEGELIKLEEGDILPIQPHQVHRVVSQENTLWLCIFVK